jgi:hypothetical protein
MKHSHQLSRRLAVLVLSITSIVICTTACTVAHAQSEWEYSLTPYLWLPNVNGTLKYDTPPGTAGKPSVDTGPNNYLENLSGVLMLSGEARKGVWALYADMIYLKFDSEKSNVRNVDFLNGGSNPISTTLNTGTTSSLEGLTWTLGASRTVISSSKGTLDALAGVRYLDIDASSDWHLSATINGSNGTTFPANGKVEAKTTLWDGIVGLRGRVQFGTSHWSLPYYFDIGTGSSQLTWQVMAGATYSFSWGDLTLAYRHLYYDQKDEALLQNFEFSGPTLGATFRF